MGVETYGGGLWHTWFDRDLSAAGRIICNEGTSANPVLRAQLIDIKRPILRVPTLAIHLDRGVNSEGFKFNAETHLTPILCTQRGEIGIGSHHQELLQVVCEATKDNRRAEQVVGMDLYLYDAQGAVLGGARNEFIFSARLDNLFMSYCALEALLAGSKDLNGCGIRSAILFDHEEIGSESAQGANSSIVEVILKRVIASLSDEEDALPRMISRSMLVSADMAHAVHPNYPEKHEECHRPRMHRGLVIKYNSNQRYATSMTTSVALKTLAGRSGVTLQEFMVRNDSACGSTIGPILSAKLGMPCVDVGVAQLSMHSCREMAGVEDVDGAIDLFSSFYSEYRA